MQYSDLFHIHDVVAPADLMPKGYCRYYHQLTIEACAWVNHKPVQYECLCKECGDDADEFCTDQVPRKGLGDTPHEALQDYTEMYGR